MAKGCILLVEDEPVHIELTLQAFEGNDVWKEIVVARDGVEALDFLFCRGEYSGRKASDLPAVVLLDLKLPKLDGFEVMRQMRDDEQTKKIPIVVLTAMPEDTHLHTAFILGANGFVTKPVDFNEVFYAFSRLGL